MRHDGSSGFFRPFENLNRMLEDRALSLKPWCPVDYPPHTNYISNSRDNDNALFIEAMSGVAPILKNCIEIPTGKHPIGALCQNERESDEMDRLKNLVDKGEGFVVSNTPEYMEGRDHSVHPDMIRRLHEGDFSIQAHIDLHGLGVMEARESFQSFMKDAILKGRRAVLIVHGRGLSSPAEPILKNAVYKWLTTGAWRKWVMAFSSAQSYDGGAGATYVLLRKRPSRKKHTG